MTDDRERLPTDDERDDASPDPRAWDDGTEMEDEISEADALLSDDDFDDELARLDALPDTLPDAGDEGEDEAAADPLADPLAGASETLDEDGEAWAGGEDALDEAGETLARADEMEPPPIPGAALPPADQEPGSGEDVQALEAEDRLRQPRAQVFRQRWRMQLGLLPLALALIGLGAFLIARDQGVDGLPDITDAGLGAALALVLAFTLVFHALLSGRRERGLLFLGLWMFATAGLIAGLVLGVEAEPQADEWWPLLLWALALALAVTYLVERTHDLRLLLVALLVGVAGGVAYWITSGEFDQALLDDAADYWPLLFSVLGIGLVPLVFRRRTG